RLVVRDDLLGANRWAVSPALAERLSVVRLVPMHPADDDLALDLRLPVLIEVADDGHPMSLEKGKLLLGRSFPEADVEVDADFPVLAGVSRRLEPDTDRK